MATQTQIQIKRSTTVNAPGSLANGELSYTSNTVGVLWIGDPSTGAVTAIGGVRNPGILTANQALVANSTSGINTVQVQQLTLQGNTSTSGVLSANGSAGTAGNILFSGGAAGNAYWSAPTSGVAGSTTDVQYNNGGALAGSAGFTFTVGSNTLYVSNSLTVGTFTANSTLTNTAAINVTNQVNTASFYASANVQVAANVLVNTTSFSIAGNTTTAPTMTLTGSNLVIGNTTSTGLPQLIVSNSTATTTINTNAISTTNIYGTLQTVAQPNITANNANYLGGTAAASYQLNSTLAANVATMTANNTTYLNGQLASYYLDASYMNAGTLPWAQAPSGTVNTSGNFTFAGNNTFAGTNTIFSSNVTASANLYVGGSVTITGNLTVSGTTTTINTTTLQINDNFLQLADGEATTTTFKDVVDMGLYIQTGNTTVADQFYSGIARIAASSTNANPYFALFATPTTPNNTTVNTSFTTGTLQAYLAPYGTAAGAAFIANSTVINITANSTLSSAIVANTLTLTTALGATYGGTGQAAVTTGDLLYGSATNTWGRLAISGTANGYILQSNGTNIIYSNVVDGGSY